MTLGITVFIREKGKRPSAKIFGVHLSDSSGFHSSLHLRMIARRLGPGDEQPKEDPELGGETIRRQHFYCKFRCLSGGSFAGTLFVSVERGGKKRPFAPIEILLVNPDVSTLALVRTKYSGKETCVEMGALHEGLLL